MAKKTADYPDAYADLSRERRIGILRTMVRIRTFETRVEELFFAGKLPGFVHLYVGEEAIASGVMATLRRDDYITSTHRGHGHLIAKGGAMDRAMAELYGKRDGYCKGKGGSMHIADFSVSMLGANGVVGGGYNIAVGAALSASIRKTDQVAVCFFGDGASNRGTFHEAMNLASVWRLPVVFVNENNHFASTTPQHDGCSIQNLAERAAGYCMPGFHVDGNNPPDVYNAIHHLVGLARQGAGPAFLECETYRIKGHFVGDPEKYRTREEVKEWASKRDPIMIYRARLEKDGDLDAKAFAAIEAEALAEVDAAVQFAEASPYPEPQEALDDIFSFSPNERPGVLQ